MKLIVLKTNLKEGLEKIERATSDNLTLPILKNCLIESIDNKI
ncbi:DNA polymerase III subunit beta, partial [Candidatus Wolfebacteria bacterium]|nr:DNA polymerase III subunit beta [Candidatus Wolfebacteria bacterium]